MNDSSNKVTLLVETFDVFRGGIPRYNRELKVSNYKNIITFSNYIKNNAITDKFLNFLYRRREILKELKNSIDSPVLHFTQPEILFESSILQGKKIVLTVHDLAVFGEMKNINLYALLRGKLFKRQFKYAISRSDLILVNSSQTKEELMRRLNVNPLKIIVINHGISKSLRPLTKEKENTIGYFGGFNHRKRVDKLIEDFLHSKIKRDYKLFIYGSEDGDYKKLKYRYSKYRNVVFKGRVTDKEVTSVLNSFKYFVFPTSYEGLGLPIIEGIACGVPTFIYEDAKIPYEIYRYPIKIKQLDDISKYDYVELRNNFLKLSKTVKERFSWTTLRKETEKAYRKLL